MNKDNIKFTIDWYEGELPEELNIYKTTDFGSEEERKKFLYGEWKVEPIDALVLYSKGNKSSMRELFGDGKIHYVNTTRLDVLDIVMGNRYKEIIVFDDGVKQEDIDIAMEYKWEV
ncbi:hypothetical protein vBVpaMR16F_150 [Vibrio phage vB_VpaM_R16F]|nr:hypothetical protein vBVpaMR16F_150 [Vibrio phage vB_VpaM_R16F]